MFDQSFSESALALHIRLTDLDDVPATNHEAFKTTLAAEAAKSAKGGFSKANPLRTLTVRRKTAYGFQRLQDELVARKLARNLRRSTPAPLSGRDFLARALQRILEEGVPCRIYRFDIRNFFESVSQADV